MTKRLCIYSVLLLSFIAGNYNGNLAIWREGAVHPIAVFPYSIKLFPTADQALLKDGFKISSDEFAGFAEDYLS